MEVHAVVTPNVRYKDVSDEKAGGATYTPPDLADFVAEWITRVADVKKGGSPLRVLDPALGDGELMLSLLSHLHPSLISSVEVCGFETDLEALEIARTRILGRFPTVMVNLTHGSFLEFVVDQVSPNEIGGLFQKEVTPLFDLIIANPPYVRTQIIGAHQAQLLAGQFGLTGRVDLYHAFLVGMAHVLKDHGIAGIIVSNRFMTTKGGGSVRQAIRTHFHIHHVWDFGDTKLFDAAVLPAVLLLERNSGSQSTPASFTSIYATSEEPTKQATTAISAVSQDGLVAISDGRRFEVKTGTLDISISADAVWRVATEAGDDWLAKVEKHTWGTFRNIGKIRVGVKTCADKVFIRTDWAEMPCSEKPELLRPLTTHHMARCFRARVAKKSRHILYPHESQNGVRKAVDLSKYPKSAAYFENHRSTLEGRTYVIEGGRKWYEIWVPQDPAGWDAPKLVFRDISEQPTFWIDLEGTIVNGDCYWLTCDRQEDSDLLWLAAAVANSTFIEAFYDHCFNNKLYAGRRRFITQYVERFPLPNPTLAGSRKIIALAKEIYESVDAGNVENSTHTLNSLIWEAFGLPIKEATR